MVMMSFKARVLRTHKPHRPTPMAGHNEIFNESFAAYAYATVCNLCSACVPGRGGQV